MNRTQKTEAKRRIADLVLTEIENHTQAGISPVDSSEYKGLSPKYKKIKKNLKSLSMRATEAQMVWGKDKKKTSAAAKQVLNY